MHEKKVIAVIVEGPSDEAALGGILKEHFSSEEVQFKVIHGDITSDSAYRTDTVVSAVEKKVEEIKNRYGYKWSDFLQIIHISDTDGAFTTGCIVQAPITAIAYYEDHIETGDIKKAEERNTHKAAIMRKLSATSQIHGIPYGLYYNSCNLEHVLYGELRDFSDYEKADMADEFADSYEGKARDFIAFISDDSVAAPGTFRETWKFIEVGKHSLERHTNIHLIFF